jgi:hypothetical protein
MNEWYELKDNHKRTFLSAEFANVLCVQSLFNDVHHLTPQIKVQEDECIFWHFALLNGMPKWNKITGEFERIGRLWSDGKQFNQDDQSVTLWRPEVTHCTCDLDSEKAVVKIQKLSRKRSRRA